MVVLSVFTRCRQVGPVAAVLAVGVTLGFAPTASAAGMPQAEIVATVAVPSPHQIVVSPPTGRIYVTSEGGTEPIYVLSPTTNTVMATIPVNADHNRNVSLGVHPATGALFLASDHYDRPGSLSAIDPLTNTITKTVPIGRNPSGLAVNPRTDKIYIADDDTKLRVVDARTLATESVIEVGAGGPAGGVVAVNPANNKVYVTKGETAAAPAATKIVDAATNTVAATVPAPNGPDGLVVNPVNGNAYVAGISEISVLAAAQNTEVARVPTSSTLSWRRIAAQPSAGQVWFGVRNGIAVMDPGSNQVIGTIPLQGKNLRPIAFGAGDRAYVGDTPVGKVHVLRILNPEYVAN